MDTSGGRGKHNLSRDDGDLSGIEPLLISPPRANHPDSNRQLDLRIVPKTPGRHQGAPSDLLHLEVVSSLDGSQHPVGGGTPGRQVELSGGSAQQSDQASRNRVGSQVSRFQSHHSKMGGARNKLVHHQAQQTAARLRQPLSGPSGVQHRRTEHGLGHSSLSVPLPSVSYPSGGVTKGEAVRQHIPGHRPAVASPVKVPRHNQSLSGSSPVSRTEGRSSGSGPSEEILDSPQSGFVPIPRLAVREHLQTAAFLASTADRIALPQTDSTGRLYNAKWETFCHWCH